MTNSIDDVLRAAAADLHKGDGIVTNVVMVYEVASADGVSADLRTASTPLSWWHANGLLEGGKIYE